MVLAVVMNQKSPWGREIVLQLTELGAQVHVIDNRHLPYEAALSTHFGQVRTLAQQHGFKVIDAVKRRLVA